MGSDQNYGSYSIMMKDFKRESAEEMPESPAILSLDELRVAGTEHDRWVRPGEYVRMDSPETIEGKAAVLPGEIFSDDIEKLEQDHRNEDGFFFTNGSKAYRAEACFSNVELKCRFPEELRDYPETVHTHNVPEWYFANGEFEMVVGNENMPEDPEELFEQARNTASQDPNSLLEDKPEWFDTYTFADETFRVDPGQYHGIISKEEGAYLGIARGDPSGEEEWIGKWSLEGDQFYDHFEEEPSLNRITAY